MERTVNAPVEVDLGNGKLNLVFDMNAMIAMEDGGLSTVEMSDENTMKSKPFGTLRKLIGFGAARHHPTLTLAEIGDMFDISQMERISQEVTAALSGNLPKANPQTPPLDQ